MVSRLVRPVVAATAAGLVLAQSGVAVPQGVPVQVRPLVGRPGTTFVVSFTAPVATGVIGSIRLRDELTLTNASNSKGCLTEVSAPVPDARRRQLVRVRLNAATLGGRWCTGRYSGKVLELQTAVCPRGTACPTYVRLRGTIARFSLTVRAAATGLGSPIFAGIEGAFACTPGPQRPGQTTPYTLTWRPASDNDTPANQIVYDIYLAHTPGGENLSQPTWTTPPGATSFRTPGLRSHGDAYFIVRARDASGNDDTNTHEQRGIDPCV